MVRLLPREETFFALLGQAADTVLHSARMLKDLLDNYHDVDRKADELKTLEDKGDDIAHTIIDRLNRTFVTPLDREDIFALTKQLDNVLDWVEASSARMSTYKIREVTPEARELAHIIVSQCEAIVEAVANLRHLERAGGALREINRLENLADHVQRDAIGKLFGSNGNPIEIMKWKEIYETLEEATDQAEDVANVIESIHAKNM